MKSFSRLLALLFVTFLCRQEVQAQFIPTTNQTASQLANKLVGPGVQILNPTLNCAGGANANFTTGTLPTTLGMDSGIVLTSGSVAAAGFGIGIASPASSFASTGTGTPGDIALSQLASLATFDACILEFDFRPLGDSIRFEYKFGSEEYPEFACTNFNDVFGFFITGPGFPVAQNIARIPGTTLPVAINTVNSAPVGTGPIANCQVYPGAPVAAYYINNSASTSIVYDGTTTLLEAKAAVTPCQTYHLKLGIADGGDGSYDSGVFLKAGSLVSTNVQLTPVGGGGLANPRPYAVRGCLPGRFFFRRQYPKPTPLTIKFQIAGTATNGVDYTQIADSVVIPADDTVAFVNIQGLAQPTPQPVENVKLYLFPPGCGATGILVDSVELEIRDSFFVQILTPDTVICRGQSFQIQTTGDSLMSFSWTPATGLSNPTIPRPIASPLTTTTYNASINLPGSGCANVNRRLVVIVKQPPIVDAGRDTTLCVGSPYLLPTQVTTAVPNPQTYTYDWTAPAGLSSNTVKNPVFTPADPGNTRLIVAVNSGAVGCTTLDTVNLRVLSNILTINNPDTVVCKGYVMQVDLTGDAGYSYLWTPTAGVSNPLIQRPFLKPDTSTRYTVTASFPGCASLTKSVKIDVEPVPTVDLGPDRQKCQWDTLQINPTITPDFDRYIFSWTPTNAVVDPTTRRAIFNAQDTTRLALTVSTPAGCSGRDSMNIVVFEGNFGKLTGSNTDVSVCPRDTLRYVASGGKSYAWTPSYYLTSATDSAVTVRPVTSVNYAVTITDVNGCTDTLYADVNVFPEAILNLPDSVVLYPGDSAILVAQGNGSSFTWYPGTGLSATNISNPVATPTVDTRYFVQTLSEAGCIVRDSVDVLVRQESVLALPNAFAPGGGPNSQLKIVRQGIASLNYLRIFNRWGNTVFETKNIDEGWDGTFKGAEQPMGVYIYQVDAITPTGRRFTQQGNITLIR
jgi:gliding motility-associated-like protein